MGEYQGIERERRIHQCGFAMEFRISTIYGLLLAQSKPWLIP
jgi:hypothetical protein